MRNLMNVVVAVVALALAHGCGGDAGGGASCPKLCEISASLHCPNDPATGCVAGCEGQVSAAKAACRDELNAALACQAAADPATQWECNSATGRGGTKSGVCQAESTAYGTCAFSK